MLLVDSKDELFSCSYSSCQLGLRTYCPNIYAVLVLVHFDTPSALDGLRGRHYALKFKIFRIVELKVRKPKNKIVASWILLRRNGNFLVSQTYPN